MEHLHRLKGAVDQPRRAIEKSETKNITIEEEQSRGTRQTIQISLKPSSALGLRAQ